MRKLLKAIRCAIKIYNSEQFFICTVKNKWFETDSDIKHDVLKYIVDDTIDVTLGEHNALKEAKELLYL